MAMTARSLPDDVDSLKAMVLELLDALDRATAENSDLRAKCGELEKKVGEQDREILVLKEDNKTYRRVIFGKSSEGYVGEKSDGEQGNLPLENPNGTEDGSEEGKAGERGAKGKSQKTGKPRRSGRRTSFAHLRRVVNTVGPKLEPAPEGYEWHELDPDISQRLDYIPAEFLALETRRQKFVLRKKSGAEECSAETGVDACTGDGASDACAADTGVGSVVNGGSDGAVINNDVVAESANPVDVRDGSGNVTSISEDTLEDMLCRIYEAPARRHIVVGGIPTERLLAHIAVSKYADSCPLYRQHKIYNRMGVYISRQTMANWMMAVGRALQPLVDLLLERIRKSEKVFADETQLKAFGPGKHGELENGYLWTYAVDDTLYGKTAPRIVVYVYERGRGSEHPDRHLGPFRGFLQVDGWKAYITMVALRDAAAKAAGNREGEGSIKLARCWAHLRRYFRVAHDTAPSEITTKTLELMKRLWKVERDVRGKDPDLRLAERCFAGNSKDIVAELFSLWEEALPKALPKSKLREAIEYGLNARKAFELFLLDGRVELDSNFVEANIRPQTVTRKNSLFCGSEGGAESWANIGTLLQTAELNGVNPSTWLVKTLERIADGWPKERFDELLPFKREPVEAPKAPPPDPPDIVRRTNQGIAGAGSLAAEPVSSPCRRAA
ncbi:MAG: IS66 family transposase [Phycisphaerales bacterium]|nr:IS66 family transposase [Phycisphaerales bacterium]